jgi:hypothetical protein
MKRGRKKLISIDEAIGSAFVEEMLARSGVVGYAVAGKAIVGWS